MSEDKKYKHVEAFCLMRYQCERCGSSELLWNSRDGVTPFCIGCTHCEKGTMSHVDWRADLRVPDHVPWPGQRIFRDLTMDEAMKIAANRIEVVGRRYPELAPPSVEDLARDIFSDGRAPCVDVRSEVAA